MSSPWMRPSVAHSAAACAPYLGRNADVHQDGLQFLEGTEEIRSSSGHYKRVGEISTHTYKPTVHFFWICLLVICVCTLLDPI